jgi:carboxypeptidase Q
VRRLLLLAVLAACKSGAGAVPTQVPIATEAPADPDQDLAEPPAGEGDDEPAEPPPPATPIADEYRDVAARIIERARADRGSWDKLAHLTDRIGNRLSGSKAMAAAVSWTAEAMRADGHDVTLQPVKVPHWVRGKEAARITAPIQRDLVVTALGGTVGTPKAGVRGKVVVVHSWDELNARAADVKGAIVLYDVAMPAWTDENGSGYGKVAPYRWAGPSAAARHGASAVLMRSVTAHSRRTPHTGSMGYDPKLPRIPAAAITTEDADLIARLAAKGDVSVQLELGAKTLPDADSHNVIAEIKGREKPEEVVLLGAHLDSWDVGQGAHDDGAGCVHVMQALTILRQLGLQPRRTIRVVLYTNEENGGAGGRGYAEANAASITRHVAALESDSGGYAPRGLDVQLAGEAGEAARAKIADLVTLLGPTGMAEVDATEHAGADISPLTQQGVLGLGFRTDGRTYFDIHHTPADTLDKVNPQHLADGVAAVAVIAYVLADLPEAIHVPASSAAPAKTAE